jgi:hypothetical protein
MRTCMPVDGGQLNVKLLLSQVAEGRKALESSLPLLSSADPSLLPFSLPTDFIAVTFGQLHFSIASIPVAAPAVEHTRGTASANALVVEVRRASLLSPASSYVAFKLLDCPDAATITVPNSKEPAFQFERTFDIGDRVPIESLHDKTVDFFIIDDNDPDTSSFLSFATVSLAPLSRGLSITGGFEVFNDNGDRVGSVEVGLRWLHPLSVPLSLQSLPSPPGPLQDVKSEASSTQAQAPDQGLAVAAQPEQSQSSTFSEASLDMHGGDEVLHGTRKKQMYVAKSSSQCLL